MLPHALKKAQACIWVTQPFTQEAGQTVRPGWTAVAPRALAVLLGSGQQVEICCRRYRRRSVDKAADEEQRRYIHRRRQPVRVTHWGHCQLTAELSKTLPVHKASHPDQGSPVNPLANLMEPTQWSGLCVCRQANAAAKARRTQEEDELALEVAEAVKARVEEAMKSEAVAQRIQTRLTEERAKLEEKVRDLLNRQGCLLERGWVNLGA